MKQEKTKKQKGKSENSLAVAGKNKEQTNKKEKNGNSCKDKNCIFHGNLKSRGRIFEGKVTKKFPRRIVVEFERMVYVPKYERYYKSKTKIHARLPGCKENEVNLNDTVLVQECRPLSKIIHFTFIKKIKSENNEEIIK